MTLCRKFSGPRKDVVQPGSVYISILITKIRKLCQDIFHISVNVKVVGFCCFTYRVRSRTCFRPVNAVYEQPVPLSDTEWTDGSLGRLCEHSHNWRNAVSNPSQRQDATGSSAAPSKELKLRRSFSHWSKQRKPTRRTLITIWNTCWRHFPARRSVKQTLSSTTVCPGQTPTGLMSLTRRRPPCVSLRTSVLPSVPGRPAGKTGVHKAVAQWICGMTEKEYLLCHRCKVHWHYWHCRVKTDGGHMGTKSSHNPSYWKGNRCCKGRTFARPL